MGEWLLSRRDFVPERQADSSQERNASACLAPVIWPEGARKLSPGFTLGLPWVSGNKRFALKGLEAQAIRSRGLELIPGTCLVAPSGLVRVGDYPG